MSQRIPAQLRVGSGLSRIRVLSLFCRRLRHQVVTRTRTVCLIDLGRVDIRHADFVFCTVFVDDMKGITVVDFGDFSVISIRGFLCMPVLPTWFSDDFGLIVSVSSAPTDSKPK